MAPVRHKQPVAQIWSRSAMAAEAAEEEAGLPAEAVEMT